MTKDVVDVEFLAACFEEMLMFSWTSLVASLTRSGPPSAEFVSHSVSSPCTFFSVKLQRDVEDFRTWANSAKHSWCFRHYGSRAQQIWFRHLTFLSNSFWPRLKPKLAWKRYKSDHQYMVAFRQPLETSCRNMRYGTSHYCKCGSV